MTGKPGPGENEIYAFISECIDSVPHLEALLLLWNTRPKRWSAAEIAERLYVNEGAARKLLQDLHRDSLVSVASGKVEEYGYRTESEASDALISAVDETYRRDVVRVSTLIHSKAPSAVRDFARAFRFKKETS
jgi:predicted transcriptional regulator